MDSVVIWISGVFCFLVAYLAADIMGLLGRGNQFPVKGRTVVVTGASQGMGLGVAKELAKKGANIAVVARNVAKLQEAVKSISESGSDLQSQKFKYFSVDLREAEECNRLIDEVTAWNNNSPPDIVFCCAGESLPTLFIDASPERLRQQMDTIYWSAAWTAHATLRSWLKPGSSSSSDGLPRHLVFTCSVVAFMPLVGYAPYTPAKAAMRGLSETLMQEIQLYNGARKGNNNKDHPIPAADVKIHTIFPAGILSPGYENEEKIKPDITKKIEESDTPQTGEEVARRSIKGLEKGESMITTNLVSKLMKSSSLGGSPRDNIVVDTLMSWLCSVIMLFVGPDMARMTWKWGKEKGTQGKVEK